MVEDSKSLDVTKIRRGATAQEVMSAALRQLTDEEAATLANIATEVQLSGGPQHIETGTRLSANEAISPIPVEAKLDEIDPQELQKVQLQAGIRPELLECPTGQSGVTVMRSRPSNQKALPEQSGETIDVESVASDITVSQLAHTERASIPKAQHGITR